MVYDNKLADRIRKILGQTRGVTEKNMFGGLSFLLNGKMCCGIIKNDLVVRVGEDVYEETIIKPHARPMDFTGRPIKGFVFVGPAGHKSDKDLRQWVQLSTDYAKSLPVKKSKVKK